MLPCHGFFWFRARMIPALNKFCHAGKTKMCPGSMSCVSLRLTSRSCGKPVHIDHQCRTESTHAGVKQCPLWENYSLHSFCFLNSVSLAMLKAEQAGVFQTPQTFCQEDSLVADAGPPISPPRKARIEVGSSISQCWAESLNLSLQMRWPGCFLSTWEYARTRARRFENLDSPKTTGWQPTGFKGFLLTSCWCIGFRKNV